MYSHILYHKLFLGLEAENRVLPCTEAYCFLDGNIYMYHTGSIIRPLRRYAPSPTWGTTLLRRVLPTCMR